MHGLIVNHGIIVSGHYDAKWENGQIEYKIFRKQNLVECEEKLCSWVTQQNFDLRKVKILTAIIYLNIAALHHYPYSLLLYGLGKKMLNQELR